jgi:hypothetical protein
VVFQNLTPLLVILRGLHDDRHHDVPEHAQHEGGENKLEFHLPPPHHALDVFAPAVELRGAAMKQRKCQSCISRCMDKQSGQR